MLFVIGTVYAVKNDLGTFFMNAKNAVTNIVRGTNTQNTSDLTQKISEMPRSIEPGPLVVKNKDSGNVTSDSGTITSDSIINFTNQERTKAGLAPLVKNDLLAHSSKSKTNDMFALEYFEHVSPSGKTLGALSKEAGYDYILIGENLAMGDFANSKAVVTAWMNSPGHRANILNGKFTDIGVTAKYAMYHDQMVWMIVQHFGTPVSLCGIVDDSLKLKIDTEQADLALKEQELVLLKKELENGGGAVDFTHEQKVEDYNARVKIYNGLVIRTKEDIGIYNEQVRSFNTCVQSKQ